MHSEELEGYKLIRGRGAGLYNRCSVSTGGAWRKGVFFSGPFLALYQLPQFSTHYHCHLFLPFSFCHLPTSFIPRLWLARYTSRFLIQDSAWHVPVRRGACPGDHRLDAPPFCFPFFSFFFSSACVWKQNTLVVEGRKGIPLACFLYNIMMIPLGGVEGVPAWGWGLEMGVVRGGCGGGCKDEG